MHADRHCHLKRPFLAVFLVLAGASSAVASAATLDDYAHLRQGRYSAPITLPQGGIEIVRDVATISLESGTVRLLSPTADGRITGLVFSGRGRFHMTVPDPVEREQLARMAEKPGLEAVDETFETLVLRTSEDLLDSHFPQRPTTFGSVDDVAAKRHENWLESRFVDVDQRVVAGLLNPGDEFLRVDLDTAGHGWMTFTFDGLNREEIGLTRWDPPSGFTEHWVSLDRAEDRDAKGRPASPHRPHFDLVHVDIEVDLREASKRLGEVGYSGIHARQGKLRAAVTVEPLVEGPRMLWFGLGALSRVHEVLDEEGRPLGFVREHIGGLDRSIDKLLSDNDLVVVLDRPLRRGEPRTVTVVYEQPILNYLPGGGWYPVRSEDSFQDLHTAAFTIVARKKHDIRSMGRLVDETVDGDDKRVRYAIESPVKMATFSFAERFHEETMQHGDAPEIVAFATSSGSSAKNKSFNVAADLTNAINYFQQIFADELEVPRLYATAITSFHGQAFDGFLHLSEWTFEYESKGATERFRAHEAAHQWWGHIIGWDSYRDQWLSEAFAEYSAMMFVQTALENGQKEYDEFLRQYEMAILGGEKTEAGWARTGPIGVGYRASTGDNVGGYQQQIYRKGALVMHMLRTLMRNLTKSDDAFIQVLRTFVDDFEGKDASTEDFIATVTKVAPADWQWFFDQWVYGTAIPTYEWRYSIGKDPNGKAPAALTLEVAQHGVPEGFRMPVPVKLDFGKGKEGQIVVLVDEAHETFTIGLPAKPKKVELNPDRAVLARMKSM